jgi:Cu/Ag efflux protein CusF
MRGKFIPAVLAVAIGLSSAAFAATTTVGTIKAIDAKAGSITLADGTAYMVPKGFKLDAFKVGEKVSVLWNMNGKAHDATEVKAAG